MPREHKEALLISEYIDGELGPDQNDLLERHIAACLECGAHAAALENVKKTVSALPHRPMPAWAIERNERWLSGLERPAAREAKGLWLGLSRPWLWVPLGSAAAAAVMAAGFFLARRQASGALPFEPLLAAHLRYSAGLSGPGGNLIAANDSDQWVYDATSSSR
ncbi:MAG: anti-sigma factor family protein [Elusimicrobiota bacterium]